MTEQTTLAADDGAPAQPAAAPKRRAAGLSGKVLAELQQIAGELGISGTAKMRKGALIEAIKQAQSGGTSAPTASAPDQETTAAQTLPGTDAPPAGDEQAPARRATRAAGARRDDQARESAPEQQADQARTQGDEPRRNDQRGGQERANGAKQNDAKQNDAKQNDAKQNDAKQNDAKQGDDRGGQDRSGGAKQNGAKQGDGRQNDARQNDGRQNDKQNDRGGHDDRGGQDRSNDAKQNDGKQNDNRAGNDDGWDDEGGGRRRNRNRNRNRNRDRDRGGNQGGGGSTRDRGPDAEPTVTEDDVLIPAAGILDVLDNYAFVRTSGYLPGPNDVYVSLSMVRKWGLRRGDAVVGQVRQTREGERKEKFNPLVKIESVNGMSIDEARKRVEFSKLTPLYASERLRLETEQTGLTGRIIDIVSPIGKGQRGLIVSPPKAGKTMVMQAIANAISVNNPECHLMIVLVDERPEEVTDFQRTVKGEVIASTFDRPASDHTTVAELAIERAKRLVELGHDVVVLLDGITRLGRAYNLSAPASGRILSGGVDSAALYPPKKFFGAARNIEDGGSLTILATALIETGSRMDEVIFEEFKGTGNMELRLRREFADKRIFPAIDVVGSGTRREELIMGKDELAVVWKLRRVLSGLEGQQGLELMIERLKKSSSNGEFLMQVQKTTPHSGGTGAGTE
ncbi:transcription termination factor Rho [Solicola sp. PLA-1-18]|uniref:transcription termination factor Rho n=1 Tax=Solicola sp. PLA-1-18 TaxID=3380532 RepID=UPI003B76EA04